MTAHPNPTSFAIPAIDPDSARAAFIAAIDAEMIKAQRNCVENASMPHDLLQASMWLIAQGRWDEPCDGEDYFGWRPLTVRHFLSSMSDNARSGEVEAGRKVIEGLLAAAFERKAA